MFDWLQEEGNITDEEMLKTFNCGIGMVLCVASENADAVLAELAANNEDAYVVGDIGPSDTKEPVVNYV